MQLAYLLVREWRLLEKLSEGLGVAFEHVGDDSPRHPSELGDFGEIDECRRRPPGRRRPAPEDRRPRCRRPRSWRGAARSGSVGGDEHPRGSTRRRARRDPRNRLDRRAEPPKKRSHTRRKRVPSPPSETSWRSRFDQGFQPAHSGRGLSDELGDEPAMKPLVHCLEIDLVEKAPLECPYMARPSENRRRVTSARAPRAKTTTHSARQAIAGGRVRAHRSRRRPSRPVWGRCRVRRTRCRARRCHQRRGSTRRDRLPPSHRSIARAATSRPRAQDCRN